MGMRPAGYLEPNRKMLFYLELIAEKDQSDKKQIDGKRYCRIFLYLFPGLFHFGAPVNVVKDHQAGIVQTGQQLVEIPHSGLVPVIAIDKCQIELR